MKLILLTFVAIFTFSSLNSQSLHQKKVSNSRQKVVFEENKGQVHDENWQVCPDVLFTGTDGDFAYHIKKNGISYQLNKVEPLNDTITLYRIDVEWVGNNQDFEVVTDSQVLGYNNYYNVPSGVVPALFVKSYKGVWLKNIYDGIDVHYYEKDGGLEYDYVVAPGADYSKIQFEIKGADEIKVDEDGNLRIKTPLGEIRESGLSAFEDGKKQQITWKLNGDKVSLNIENRDIKKSLIIDPGVRIWGTYYGGSSEDVGRATSVGDDGSNYLAGYTKSTTNISTSGVHQVSISGNQDAFLVKFDDSGVRQWGTYYGGSGNDVGNYCPVDLSNNDVFIAGYSASTSGIATDGSHQSAYGGSGDAFLAKFDDSGVRQWATYYGGTSYDYGYAAKVDQSGSIFFVGNTKSTTNISTSGAYQENLGGNQDAFLVKFDTDGNREWATYYGGTSLESGESCSLDPVGNIFFAGRTYSSTNISTEGSHQEVYGAGAGDAYLVKFDTDGNRDWATYYGGSGIDYGFSCVVDMSGDVYLAGPTESSNNISTSSIPNILQASKSAGRDAFLVKFNNNGVRQWGTYYGGSGFDSGECIEVLPSGSIIMSGYSASSNLQTALPHQASFGGGNYDAFIIEISNNGQAPLLWGTYYGGSSIDVGRIITSDECHIYMSGHTASNNNISTAASHQIVHSGGGHDAFLVQFSTCEETLPVELLKFEAELIKGQVLLNWETQSELNNDYFLIERSIDGLQWESIGKVSGNGTSNISHNYETIDGSPLLGLSYYRLKQVDFDGAFAFSEIREIYHDQELFNIYPNPATEFVTVELSDNVKNIENTDIEIIDLNGKTLKAIKAKSEKTNIDVSDLSTGVYFVKVGNTVKKVMVQ